MNRPPLWLLNTFTCDRCEEADPRRFQQSFVDRFVQATLERSGLIPASAPLKMQKRDKYTEDLVNELFKAIIEDQ